MPEQMTIAAALAVIDQFEFYLDGGVSRYPDHKEFERARLTLHAAMAEPQDYYVVTVDHDACFVFEGTIAQFDNNFGIAIDATEAQCADYARSQGWSLYRRVS